MYVLSLLVGKWLLDFPWHAPFSTTLKTSQLRREILTGSHVFLPSTVGSPFTHLGGARRTCRGQGGKAWSLLPPAQPSGYCWASHTVSFLEPQFSHRYNGNEAQAYFLHLVLSGVSTEMEEAKMTQHMGTIFIFVMDCNTMKSREGRKTFLRMFTHECL